ncbi:MAG: right-handed parallel beta-helix repeat-containing protein [Candidatus Dependentiae bacterium]
MMKQTKLITGALCLLPIYISATSPQPGKRMWDIAAENEIIFNTIESKVCVLADTDLNTVFTVIEELNQKTSVNDSNVDTLDSLVDSINEVRTDFEQALSNVCLLESEIQSAADNVIDANDAIGQVITDADVGLTGTTIGLPGKYILCEEIDTSAAVAITIASDDVELNFNGFAIRNAAIAIGINSGFSNITVKNGFVVDTTGNSIDVDTASSVTFENIWIDNSSSNGFNIDTCSNVTIRSCLAARCITNQVNISSSDNILIQKCLFGDRAASGTAAGIACSSSSRITIQKCNMSNNLGRGIEFSNCDTFEIFNCMCSANSLEGIRLTTCSNGLLRENFCIDNDTQGIHLLTNGTQIKLIGNICSGSVSLSEGIRLNEVTNCYVFENIALGNSNTNINESAGGPNTFLSNWALGNSSSSNYISTTSTINRVTINQGISSSSQPTKWQNIDMRF